MSTTEELRTQLDPVVRASSWRTVDLRDEHPEQAEMVNLEDELKENERLSQQVSELAGHDGDGERTWASSPEVGRLQEELARSEEGAAELVPSKLRSYRRRDSVSATGSGARKRTDGARGAGGAEQMSETRRRWQLLC